MNDYCFESFKEFFEYNLKKREVLTLNDLAKKIGYNSPSLLSMIATGKRLPSAEILENFFNEWKTEPSLREIIRLRLEIEKKTKKRRSTGNLIEKLARLDKKSVFKTIDLDTFSVIKEWHYLVLQQLMSGKNVKRDPVYLSYRLRKKVSPSQIKKAITTLEKISLKSAKETTHDIPSEAIRGHHRGMILRGLEALEEQSIDDRHFNSLTMKFNSSKKTQAKAAILNFVREFNNTFYDEHSENIYQLNIQLFEHTQDIQR